MPFDGNGNYSVPSGTAAVSGEVIDSGAYNAFLADLVSALSGLVKRDGQSAMSGNLPMGGNRITGVGAAVSATDAVVKSQLDAVSVVAAGAAADLLPLYAEEEVDVASAATTVIGGLASNKLRLTGTTTITSFGTVYEGPIFMRLAGDLQITPGSAMLTPYGKTLYMRAGDTLLAWPKATSGTADGWIIVPLGQYNDRLSSGAALGDPGTVFDISSGATLSTGKLANTVFAIRNTTSSAVLLTQDTGLTLRLAGTALTGNRTLGPYGMASVYVVSPTEYVISGVS